MSNRTFCVLLASALMLFGAAAALFSKELESEENTPVQEAAVQLGQEIKKEETFLLPAQCEIEEAYGAAYSEQYEQWFLREKLRLKIKGSEMLYVPLSGKVERIEGMEAEGQMFSAGSRISLRCGGYLITLWPVYGVRVFEGSSVTQQSILGSMGDSLTISAQKDGVPIDPMSISILESGG